MQIHASIITNLVIPVLPLTGGPSSSSVHSLKHTITYTHMHTYTLALSITNWVVPVIPLTGGPSSGSVHSLKHTLTHTHSHTTTCTHTCT